MTVVCVRLPLYNNARYYIGSLSLLWGKAMHPILKKTFGGLSSQYYLRHLVFGIGIAVLFFAMLSQGTKEIPLFTLLMCIVNTLLYPYSRFVYESVIVKNHKGNKYDLGI